MMRSSAAPEKPLNIRNDSGERLAIIWFTRQRLGVNDELSALRALQRRRKRGLDAELIRLMRRALSNAFDLPRVQPEDVQNRHASSCFAGERGQPA
jgi:hypothetical protein